MQQIAGTDSRPGAFPVVLQRPGGAFLQHSVAGQQVDGGQQPLPVRPVVRVVGPAPVHLGQLSDVVGQFLEGE